MFSQARRRAALVLRRTIILTVAVSLSLFSSAMAFMSVRTSASAPQEDNYIEAADTPGTAEPAEEVPPEFLPLAVIFVDGEPVAAAGDRSELSSAVNAVIAGYEAKGAVFVRLENELTLYEGGAPASLLCDSDELAERLASKLTVVTQMEVYEDSDVPYVTVYEYDADGFEDEIETISEGHEGILRQTYIYTFKNDVLTKALFSSAEFAEEPVDEVIRVGAQSGSRYDSRGYFIWPVEGNITSRFGYRTVSVGTNNHRALDIAAPKGTDVKAADSGTVVYSGWHDSYGNYVKLQHDNGSYTLYAHLSKRLVKAGDRVAQGDIIGKVGSTGESTGPHLHFEVRTPDNVRVDPEDYLPAKK